MLLRDRLLQLFIVKRFHLHWRIDTHHSAPTGEWVNIDGIVYHADEIITHITKLRARRLINGKRTQFTASSLNDLRPTR